MKIILTGSTGFIGSQVLKQCLSHPSIDLLVVLSRRRLPQLDGNPKAQVIVMEDYLHYSPAVLQTIDGSDAVIWSMGSNDVAPVLDLEYPRAFFDAFTSTPSFASRSQPFHHVHLSGALVEPDQSRSLWFLQAARKSKGLAMTKILALASEPGPKGLWKPYVVRPGGVLPPRSESRWYHSLMYTIMGPHYSTANDELAAMMIHLAIDGGIEPVISSQELGEGGRKLLA